MLRVFSLLTLPRCAFLTVAMLALVGEAQTISLIDIGATPSTTVGGPTTSPDINGNYWSTLSTPAVATALVNRTNGATTGGTLTVTGNTANAGFTGAGFANSTPAPGAFNVATAYGDAWFDDVAGGAMGTFRYASLNPASTYALTLWGNRSASWTDGIINVTSGTVGGGGDFALPQNSLITFAARPNAAGEIAFTLDKNSALAGSTVLNVMQLDQLATTSPSPSTRSMSVNFGIALNDANMVNPDESAVTGNPHARNVSGAAWNNVLLQTSGGGAAPTNFTANTQGGNSLQLINDQGNVAGQLTSSGTFFSDFANTSSPNQAATGDAGLFQSFLTLGGTSAPSESVTVSGLASDFTTNGYDVVVFFDIAQARTYGLTVSDGARSQTFWTSDVISPDADANNDGSIEWVQALAANEPGATVGSNYAVFTGFRNSSFTITGLGSNGRAAISGFQVIALTPEPASLAMWSVLAALGVLVTRRTILQQRGAGFSA